MKIQDSVMRRNKENIVRNHEEITKENVMNKVKAQPADF